MDAFIGTIMPWAGSWAPNGWAICDGRLLQIAQYNAVFAVLGTTYGGDGRNTFGIPNLMGRIPVGDGQSPGTSVYTLGETEGAEIVQLNSNTMPVHNHGASVSGMTAPPPVVMMSPADADTHTPAAGFNTLAALYDAGNLVEYADINGSAPTLPLNTGGTASVLSSKPVSLGATGTSTPFSILQPYQVINFIMCLEGIYPPRN